jgi:hypothetical protein
MYQNHRIIELAYKKNDLQALLSFNATPLLTPLNITDGLVDTT